MQSRKKTYLKFIGYVEGTSLLLLVFIGMPLKYWFELPEVSRGLGTAHGCFFLMYLATLITTGSSIGLSKRQVGLAAILSSVPFGVFIFEARLRKEAKPE